jgi:hypothetical protein
LQHYRNFSDLGSQTLLAGVDVEIVARSRIEEEAVLHIRGLSMAKGRLS